MIGIGGVSMSGIAIILQKAGYEVTGSDKNEGDMIDILIKMEFLYLLVQMLNG